MKQNKFSKILLSIVVLLTIMVAFPDTGFAQEATETTEMGFVDMFLGGMSIIAFTSYMLWAYIGVAVNVLLEYQARSAPDGKEWKQDKFSFSYWWKDNRMKILLSCILVPVAIVFSKEVIGMSISNWTAVLIGGGSDRLLVVVRKFIKRKWKSEESEDSAK